LTNNNKAAVQDIKSNAFRQEIDNHTVYSIQNYICYETGLTYTIIKTKTYIKVRLYDPDFNSACYDVLVNSANTAKQFEDYYPLVHY